MDQPKSNPKALREAVAALVQRLQSLADKRVSQRKSIEDRWLEDIEQYYGRYDAQTAKSLRESNLSQVFVNMTQKKTNSMAARLGDLLFPTDDRNWDIGPTPEPELATEAEKAAAASRMMQQQLAQAAQAQQQGGQPDPRMQALEQAARAADEADKDMQARIAEGKSRAKLMARKIEDQLTESLYAATMRKVIEDACKLGTGVAKGPVTGDRVRKGWKRGPDGAFTLQTAAGAEQPAMRHVDIWGFCPDMAVDWIGNSEGVFERHLMNKRQLRVQSKLPGYDQDAVRNVLNQEPRGSTPDYLTRLRTVTGEQSNIASDLYQVWEYSGPIEAKDMLLLAEAVGDEATVEEMTDADPLVEYNCVVVFCQGEVLKFALYPMDSGETMYSVFNLMKDEASVFGFGIPWMIRHPQRMLNGAVRAMMDNAGLAAGPQIVIAKDLVQPQDGTWGMVARKVWLSEGGLPQDRAPFSVFNVPMNSAELSAVIALALRFVDEMSELPQIAQGEQGTGVTKTAQGMALLMNGANVTFRRIVKQFDDDMTVPNIRRFYDWDMQFSADEAIKGDFEIDARGSSVLLVREMQAQNLMFVATNLGAHPVFGPMLKNRDVLRKLFQSMMIPADEVVLTDDEIDAIMMRQAAEAEAAAKAQAEGGQQVDDGAKVAVAQMQDATKRWIAQLQVDADLTKAALSANLKTDEVTARMEAAMRALDSKERLAAADIAVTAQIGQPSVLTSA